MTFSRLSMYSAAALLFGILITVFVSSSSLLGMFAQAVIYAIFALGVGFLLRQNGLVSFGHALYFGGAGYGIGVILALDLVSAEWAIPMVVLGAGVLAFLIALVIVRVPGIAFGMLTLAIGQMAYLLASRARGITGGADGMGVGWPNAVFGVSQSVLLKPANLFLLSWVCLWMVTLAMVFLMRSHFGSITEAIRDNEERARFIGIQTTVPRALVYSISAMVTAVAGVLSVFNTGFVSPESLHWSVSAITLLMVVVGGVKSPVGPVIGAVVYFLFKDLLGEYATHSMAIFGAALIAVIVFSPDGLSGALQRLFSKASRDPGRTGSVGH